MLCLWSLWRARDWREHSREIEHAIAHEHALDTVQVSEIKDADQQRIFDAALRNRHVKVLKFYNMTMDYQTLLRLFESKHLELLMFYNTHFTDLNEMTHVIQSNSSKLKYVSFDWLDDGLFADAVSGGSLRHRSLAKTLQILFCSLESDGPPGHWSIRLKKTHHKKHRTVDSLMDDEDGLYVFHDHINGDYTA